MVSLAPGQRAAAQISGPRPVIALTVDHLVDEPLNGFLILAMTQAASRGVGSPVAHRVARM